MFPSVVGLHLANDLVLYGLHMHKAKKKGLIALISNYKKGILQTYKYIFYKSITNYIRYKIYCITMNINLLISNNNISLHSNITYLLHLTALLNCSI